MAISKYKNGHFEEIGASSQILQIVTNSTLFYLSFDTHDIPGSVFIWKYKFTMGFVNVGKIWVKCPCVIVEMDRVHVPLFSDVPVHDYYA